MQIRLLVKHLLMSDVLQDQLLQCTQDLLKVHATVQSVLMKLNFPLQLVNNNTHAALPDKFQTHETQDSVTAQKVSKKVMMEIVFQLSPLKLSSNLLDSSN